MRTSATELDGTYQRKVGELVSREVVYNVSHLIYALTKSDDILEVSVRDDYQTAATEEGWRVFVDVDEVDGYIDNNENVSYADDWQDLCDEQSIDPRQIEAYEHWIVTDWFANKLREHGEMVSDDIHGLTVWGRTTTGQAILLDSVICDIYDDLHR